MYENKWIYYNERKEITKTELDLQLSKVQGEVSPRPAFSPCTYSNDSSSERHKYISQYANAKESGAQ